MTDWCQISRRQCTGVQKVNKQKESISKGYIRKRKEQERKLIAYNNWLLINFETAAVKLYQ